MGNVTNVLSAAGLWLDGFGRLWLMLLQVGGRNI